MKQKSMMTLLFVRSGGWQQTISLVVGCLCLVFLASTAEAQLNKTLHTDGWILAAAHAQGHQGSIWRTDLWIYFDSYTGGSAELFFCAQDQDNSSARGFVVEVESGEKVAYVEDVVDQYLDLGSGSWVGAIHYVADRQVQVYARVYSISADGSRSFGQLVEGIPTADMSIGSDSPDYPGSDEDQRMHASKHTSDGRFRVNVGVVNPTAVPTGFWVAIYEDGNHPPDASPIHLQLPPFSMRQLSDPFADVSGGDWSDYTIRVQTEDDGAGGFGYISVVDNATNDAYFVRGVKRFPPDQ